MISSSHFIFSVVLRDLSIFFRELNNPVELWVWVFFGFFILLPKKKME